MAQLSMCDACLEDIFPPEAPHRALLACTTVLGPASLMADLCALCRNRLPAPRWEAGRQVYGPLGEDAPAETTQEQQQGEG